MAFQPYTKLFLLLALCLGAVVAQGRYEVTNVDEGHRFMEPAVKKRGLAVLTTDGKVPPRGAIVWFRHPKHSKTLISRVIAVAGDRISVAEGGVVLNGEAVSEEFARTGRRKETMIEIRVPAGHVFVLNDARAVRRSRAADSRELGPIAVLVIDGYRADDRAGELLDLAGGGL